MYDSSKNQVMSSPQKLSSNLQKHSSLVHDLYSCLIRQSYKTKGFSSSLVTGVYHLGLETSASVLFVPHVCLFTFSDCLTLKGLVFLPSDNYLLSLRTACLLTYSGSLQSPRTDFQSSVTIPRVYRLSLSLFPSIPPPPFLPSPFPLYEL